MLSLPLVEESIASSNPLVPFPFGCPDTVQKLLAGMSPASPASADSLYDLTQVTANRAWPGLGQFTPTLFSPLQCMRGRTTVDLEASHEHRGARGEDHGRLRQRLRPRLHGGFVRYFVWLFC